MFDLSCDILPDMPYRSGTGVVMVPRVVEMVMGEHSSCEISWWYRLISTSAGV